VSNSIDSKKTLAVLAFSLVGAAVVGAIYGKKLFSKMMKMISHTFSGHFLFQNILGLLVKNVHFNYLILIEVFILISSHFKM